MKLSTKREREAVAELIKGIEWTLESMALSKSHKETLDELVGRVRYEFGIEWEHGVALDEAISLAKAQKRFVAVENPFISESGILEDRSIALVSAPTNTALWTCFHDTNAEPLTILVTRAHLLDDCSIHSLVFLWNRQARGIVLTGEQGFAHTVATASRFERVRSRMVEGSLKQ